MARIEIAVIIENLPVFVPRQQQNTCSFGRTPTDNNHDSVPPSYFVILFTSSQLSFHHHPTSNQRSANHQQSEIHSSYDRINVRCVFVCDIINNRRRDATKRRREREACRPLQQQKDTCLEKIVSFKDRKRVASSSCSLIKRARLIKKLDQPSSRAEWRPAKARRNCWQSVSCCCPTGQAQNKINIHFTIYIHISSMQLPQSQRRRRHRIPPIIPPMLAIRCSYWALSSWPVCWPCRLST